MASSTASGYGPLQLMGLVSVLTFGLTALVAVLGGGTLVPTIFIFGFFILVPLIAILGEDFPFVQSQGDEPATALQQDPVETLRDRFARGEIDQAEFERRLEYLVETEGLEFDVDEELGQLSTENGRARERTRERELDPE